MPSPQMGAAASQAYCSHGSDRDIPRCSQKGIRRQLHRHILFCLSCLLPPAFSCLRCFFLIQRPACSCIFRICFLYLSYLLLGIPVIKILSFLQNNVNSRPGCFSASGNIRSCERGSRPPGLSHRKAEWSFHRPSRLSVNEHFFWLIAFLFLRFLPILLFLLSLLSESRYSYPRSSCSADRRIPAPMPEG